MEELLKNLVEAIDAYYIKFPNHLADSEQVQVPEFITWWEAFEKAKEALGKN